MASNVVHVRLVVDNPKAIRALKVVLECLSDVAEDFEYRDDVKNAVKAARYLNRHLRWKPHSR